MVVLRHSGKKAKRRGVITLLPSPEQYAEKGLERTVSRPAVCPYCTNRAALEAHGYYQRWQALLQRYRDRLPQTGLGAPFPPWAFLVPDLATAQPTDWRGVLASLRCFSYVYGQWTDRESGLHPGKK